MKEKRLLGVLATQRNRQVVSGVITAKDLIDIYEIDQWQPGKNIEEQGCQRPPITAHFRKIGRKLKNEEKTTLPTSITLSANLLTKKRENKNSIRLEKADGANKRLVEIVIPEGHKVRVVDGQHRILGLQYAIQDLKQKELESFELPFVIMLVEDRIDEIQSFYEINSTSKKVATDLALQLLNEMSQHSDIDLKKPERLKLVALNVAMELNQMPDSVWYKNISVGHQGNEIASSTSFVTSLKPILNMSFIEKIWTVDIKDEVEAGAKIAPLVNNYWSALRIVMPELFPEPTDEKEQWSIQKTPGFYTWNMVAPCVLEDFMFKREKNGNFTAEEIAAFLEKYARYALSHAEYLWKAGTGQGSKANSQKAVKELADIIKDDIEENYEEQFATEITF